MAEDHHVHVYNQCACGAMWLPINGEPPPNGGSGGSSGGGGGGAFALKSANVSRAVMRARITTADAKADAAVSANKARVKKQRQQQQATVSEFRADTRELKALLKETGASVDAVQAVEAKFNTLVTQKLAVEKKKIQDKQRELTKLNKKLKLAQKNQAKIFCGMALWKILSVLTVLLIGGVIATSIL